MTRPIPNLDAEFAAVTNHWSPRVFAAVNGQYLEIAKTAHRNGTTLGEEALKAGVPAADYHAIVRLEKMVGPG